MVKEREVEVVRGTTNVFADLKLPDAEQHLVKAQLVAGIMDIMKRRKLSQAQAAKIMDIKQPDVSNLVRGRFRGYSLDRIMGFLMAFDRDIEIVVKRKPRTKRPPRMTVKAA